MYTLTYICGYMPIRRPTSHPEYTYRAYHLYWLVYTLISMDILMLTHITSAGWQLDMYMFIYINGYLSICRHICHPEYTYGAYNIYRLVSTLICMDIQIGWQVYWSADRNVHTLACIWCLRGPVDLISSWIYTQAFSYIKT